MGVALMTEKKKPGIRPADEGMTSTRLYITDSQKLNKVKALRGDDSVAVTFRELFGKLLDAQLIKLSRQTLEEMEQDE